MTVEHYRARPYFDVPASQQPLRVRPPKAYVRKRQPLEFHDNPLEQLIVGSLTASGLADEDRQEAKDAAHECAHGRLPHDTTPPCGCWPQEPPVVPDLIPDWVLADARDYQAQGMTVRRIAHVILPATGCVDLPSCEQLLALKLRLDSHASA